MIYDKKTNEYKTEGGAFLSEKEVKEYLKTRTINELAYIISRSWTKVYFGAVPYLNAMFTCHEISPFGQFYGLDNMKDILIYFKSNATTWRGPVARLVKAEIVRRTK